MLSILPLIPLFQKLSTLILAITGVGLIIGFHELGHFVFCKLFNISTPTFSIGMGPKIFSKKIGETEFTLAAIPLGGYVEIGDSQENGESAALSTNSFARKPYWQKLAVMAGGILFNFIFAYFALVALYYQGLPKTPLLSTLTASTIIATVDDESPAQKAGLLSGDQITSIDGIAITSAHTLIEQIKIRPNQSITINFQRNGHEEQTKVILGSKPAGDSAVGFLGIDFVLPPQYDFITSLKNGFWATLHLTKHVIQAFHGLFFKGQFQNLGGPLAVINQAASCAQQGMPIFLLILAFISINLGVLNIIPLPILDGGQVLYYTIEAITGRPLQERTREIMHYATWIFMLSLLVILSIKDIGLWSLIKQLIKTK